MKKINLSGLSADSITALLLAVLSVVNILCQLFGYTPIMVDDQMLYNVISSIFLIVSTGYAAYKNINITPAAQTAQTILDLLKEGTILIEDVNELINDAHIEKD